MSRQKHHRWVKDTSPETGRQTALHDQFRPPPEAVFNCLLNEDTAKRLSIFRGAGNVNSATSRRPRSWERRAALRPFAPTPTSLQRMLHTLAAEFPDGPTPRGCPDSGHLEKFKVPARGTDGPPFSVAQATENDAKRKSHFRLAS